MVNELSDAIELTPTDCHNMVLTGLCHENQMTCDGRDQCYYKPPRKPDYQYQRTTTVETFSSSYFPRVILGDSLESSLFGIPHCRAS